MRSFTAIRGASTRSQQFYAKWGGNRLTPHRLNSQDVVERKSSMRNILIVAGGLVAVAAIAFGVYSGTRPASSGPEPTPAAATAAPDKAAILTVQPTDHVEGDAKAPITLIEYASFTCPHCARFNTVELPEIKKKWIDTGKVKLVYRDFPLDETAARAAMLAQCAGDDK